MVLALVGLGAAVSASQYLPGPDDKPQEPKLPVRGEGISVSRVGPGANLGDQLVDGAVGDWLLESDKLRLVLGAGGEGVERAQRHGALIDAELKGSRIDELIDLRPLIQITGASLPLRMDGVSVIEQDGRPALRVTQAARDGRLVLETDFWLTKGKPYVEIVSKVRNTSESLIRGVQIGERARWPGASVFAPRLGFVRTSTHAEVPWLGRPGKTLSYALAFPDGPAQTRFSFDLVGPIGQTSLSRLFDLPPGAEGKYRRYLIVVEGGLGKAAEIAWSLLGKPVGRVRGVLSPPQTWATIEARHPDKRTVLSVRADRDGRYELPLPPGQYDLVLRAPGGDDEQRVIIEDKGPIVTAQLLPPQAGMLIYSVMDGSGAPLPARLVIRGIAPTADPEFGPVETAAGARSTVYTQSGQGYLELAPGRYQVHATHGLEYTLPSAEIEVNTETGATFRAVLDRVIDTSGWVASDFHLHAAPSLDSSVSLRDRVLALLAEGIEFAVATDHNHVTDYSDTVSDLDIETHLATAPGVEITTQTWGHFNAFPYPASEKPPPFSGVDPAEIFAVVRARAPSAVIQVNHPRMPGVGYFNRIELDKTGVPQVAGFSFEFDTIEIVNGFDLEDPKVFEENLFDWFELLNRGYRYTAVGNSDSHRLVYQWAGYPRTYAKVLDDRPQAVSADEVARSLIGGHAVVSNGIFIVALANGVAGPGDMLSAERVSLQVNLRAPSWVDVKTAEVYANGVLVATKKAAVGAAPATRLQFEVDLDISGDTWLVVVGRGEHAMSDALPFKVIRPFGFTNPIYIDANEDGVFRAHGAPDAGPTQPLEPGN